MLDERQRRACGRCRRERRRRTLRRGSAADERQAGRGHPELGAATQSALWRTTPRIPRLRRRIDPDRKHRRGDDGEPLVRPLLPGSPEPGFTDVDVAPAGASNPGIDGQPVPFQHGTQLCFADTNHTWDGTHQEIDNGKMDGFAIANDGTHEDPMLGPPGFLSGARAMAYYTQADLPFMYWAAKNFAIGDRYFAAVPKPDMAEPRVPLRGDLVRRDDDRPSPDPDLAHGARLAERQGRPVVFVYPRLHVHLLSLPRQPDPRGARDDHRDLRPVHVRRGQRYVAARRLPRSEHPVRGLHGGRRASSRGHASRRGTGSPAWCRPW